MARQSVRSGLLRVVIADDERHARLFLAEVLGCIPGVRVVGEAADGLEALDLIARLVPDVVCLDRRMPGLDGDDVARRLRGRASAPFVIFVTACADASQDRGDADRVLCLEKPVDSIQLQRALVQARAWNTGGGRGEVPADEISTEVAGW